ncbi:MAG: hypothetical protein KKB20_08215 [Proteobacteria bacterium]|nr:hypothetical protein [Pseudomonadota bacterium]
MDGRVKINGLRVDLPALLSIAHDCRPEACGGASCCADYEAEVDEKELAVIVGWLPAAARYARNLVTEKGLDNVFDEQGRGLYAIDRTEAGFCVFAYRAPKDGMVCSLHSAALELGRPPHRVKPSCCFLWPLALYSSRPRLLGIHPEVFEYPCNRRRRPGARGLDPGVAAIVGAFFGPDFLERLEEKAAGARFEN